MTHEEEQWELRQEADKNIKAFFEKYGFNAEGDTYIYFMRNAYNVKEELKQHHFRFTKELMWHSPEIPDGYEDKVFKLNVKDVCMLYVWGGAFLPTAAQIVKDMIAGYQPKQQIPANTKSKWQGMIDERLYDIPAIVTKRKEINTSYGETNLYEFEDADGNLFQWFTRVYYKVDPGMKVSLTGTVRKHGEYNGTKYTVLNRCILRKFETLEKI